MTREIGEQVNSPNEARAYGTGEVIVVNVVFNEEVVLEGEPTLLLETGVFNQEVCAREIARMPWNRLLLRQRNIMHCATSALSDKFFLGLSV